MNTNKNCNIGYYDEDIYSSDSSGDIDFEYLNFSKKTLEHQAKIREYLFSFPPCISCLYVALFLQLLYFNKLIV